jgi:hypothetical protein
MRLSKRNTVWLYPATTVVLLLLVTAIGEAQIDEDEIVRYRLNAPTEVQRGTSFSIDVLFTVQPDWYIYAPGGANAAQGKIETTVVFTSSPGITKAGRMDVPDPILKDGHQVYEGDSITMRQDFNVASTIKSGKYQIKGKIIYQTCNSEICLPPESEEVVLTLKIL